MAPPTLHALSALTLTVAALLCGAAPAPAPPLLDDGDAPHNAPEAWARAFAAGISSSIGGRALQGGGASTITFSAVSIAHGGNVTVTAQLDPALFPAPIQDSTSFYVALYAPRQPGAAVDLDGSTPVRYQVCAADAGFAKSGVASFRFALNNLHSGGYSAYLIKGGLAGPVSPPPAPPTQKTWVAGGSKPWTSLTGANGTRARSFAGAVLAVSTQPLVFLAPNEPTMVRVTPGNFAGEFRVTWAHDVGTTGGVVTYSPRADLSGAVKFLAPPPTTLTTEDVCALGPAATTGFRDFGAQFTAELDLRAYGGATIYYSVGASGGGSAPPSASAVLALRVPELPGAFSGRPQLWLSWADQGLGYHDESFPGRSYNNGVVALATADALAADVAALAPAAGGGMALQGLTVAGDATYADGYESVYEDYFSMMSGLLPSSPFLLSSGNHEQDWALGAQYDSPTGRTRSSSFWSNASGVAADNSISSGGECGMAFLLLPTAAATPARPYYSYAAGLMTVLSVSSEFDMAPGSPQGDWLRAALGAVDRSATPFVMLYMHRSLYVKPTAKAGAWPTYDNKFAGDWSGMQYFNAMLEPLLVAYGVDVVYTGHTHVTQRNCATRNFTCVQRPTLAADGFVEYRQPPAPVSYVIGNLGANTDNTNSNAAPPWLDFESAAFAYARIVVRSATVLEVTLVDVFSGAAIDRSRIVKAAPPAPAPAPIAKDADSGAAIGGAVAGVLLLAALGLFLAGNARARGLLASRTYSPFGEVVAIENPSSPRQAGAAAPETPALAGVVVAADGGSVGGGGDSRRARVESARALQVARVVEA
jgi:hypothetical protein